MTAPRNLSHSELTLIGMISAQHDENKQPDSTPESCYQKRFQAIKIYAREHGLIRDHIGLQGGSFVPLFNHPEFLSRFLYKVRDDLYCANMLGGDAGRERLNNAIIHFHDAVKMCMALGLSKSLSAKLLRDCLTIHSAVFLTAVKITGDFHTFSAIIDEVEPQVNALNHLRDEIDTALFIGMVSTANPVSLPSTSEIEHFKEIRNAIAVKINNGSVLSAELVKSVIEEIERAKNGVTLK